MREPRKTIVLTEQQEAWLQKHFKHTKNEKIAAKLNVSLRSVNRLAERRGLTKSKQFIRKCQEESTAKTNKIMLERGLYPPKGYIIPRSEEFRFKKGEKPIDRLGAKRNAERIARCAQSRKETFRLERARALYGLPRQTKLNVVKRPHKQIHTRYYLRKRGYIVERGSNTAYYNSETKRSPDIESRSRSGFVFLEQQAV